MEQEQKKIDAKDEQIKKMKSKIYYDCMKYPSTLCIGKECPIYDFFDDCHKQKRRGDF
jgi:hypothetical protein